jgi:hypothetical protein
MRFSHGMLKTNTSEHAMSGVNETISTVNAMLRTLLMFVLVGAAGLGGYKAYDLYNEPKKQLADKQAELDKIIGELTAQKQEVASLTTQLNEKTKEVDRLEVALQLLKVRHRLARLTVLDQREVPAGDAAAEPGDGAPKKLITKVEFVEINAEGQPIGQPKQFNIEGDLVYIDYLRVTFDDKYVEGSDLDRSTAICLFQRIFGEHQEPIDGYQLDEVGTRPTAYARGTEMSDFEKKIWNDFWSIANDPRRAAELGIKAAHEVASAMRVQPGKVYELDLRSTGDMAITPVDGH